MHVPVQAIEFNAKQAGSFAMFWGFAYMNDKACSLLAPALSCQLAYTSDKPVCPSGVQDLGQLFYEPPSPAVGWNSVPPRPPPAPPSPPPPPPLSPAPPSDSRFMDALLLIWSVGLGVRLSAFCMSVCQPPPIRLSMCLSTNLLVCLFWLLSIPAAPQPPGPPLACPNVPPDSTYTCAQQVCKQGLSIRLMLPCSSQVASTPFHPRCYSVLTIDLNMYESTPVLQSGVSASWRLIRNWCVGMYVPAPGRLGQVL
jgi:hypothetical protein